MIDLTVVADFSRNNCVEICALLVPANCLATLQSLIFVGLRRSHGQIQMMSGVACLYAVMMVLHVMTWLSIGVIRLPTFILLGLAILCLSCNGWAVAHPESLTGFLGTLASLALRHLPKNRAQWS